MTRDSGSERPQRTVAELLAEYGGASGDAPRRRRRRAEDDGDSAPQTIIERVLSDSGKLLPIRDDQQAGPRRPGGHRSGERRPVQPPPAPPQQQGPPSGYAEPARPPQAPPQSPPTGRQPVRPPAQQPQQPIPAPEPQRQFPPSRPGPQGGAMRPVQPPQAPPQQQAPPPQQQSRPAMRPVNRAPAGPPPMTSRPPAAPQRPPAPPVNDDNIATAVHPPLPDDYQPPAAQQQAPPAPPQQQPPKLPPTMQAPPVQPMQAPPVQPQQARRPGVPPEATTEEFPLVPGADQQAPQQATQRRPPAATQSSPGLESTQAHAGPYVDDDLGDYEDDFGGGGIGTALRGDEAFPSRDDEFGDYDDLDDDHGRMEPFDADEPRSGTREWLLMAAQVGVGAIAGAAVWLAFSWLWGIQPVVALVAAVLVIFGLVLGVRRWRRADDLQTTVLAVLAGLVVTVSPAALLLLHR